MELQTLQRLKAKLDELDSRSKPLQFFLEIEQEVMAMYITMERIQEILVHIEIKEGESNSTRELILNADEQFCRRNLAYHTKLWNDVFSALKLPYQQTNNRLKELNKKTAGDSKENPDATIAMLLGPAAWKIYNLGIKGQTSSNAVKTAIELYIIKAKTGKLPDELPAGLPKDLFSGKNFLYEKNDEGFILRCQGKDLDKDEIYEYEFKVKK